MSAACLWAGNKGRAHSFVVPRGKVWLPLPCPALPYLKDLKPCLSPLSQKCPVGGSDLETPQRTKDPVGGGVHGSGHNPGDWSSSP